MPRPELAEALEWGENAEELERADMAYDDEWRRIVDAARGVLAGQPVEWCEYHNAQITNPVDGTCWDRERIHPCRMVERTLSNQGDE